MDTETRLLTTAPFKDRKTEAQSKRPKITQTEPGPVSGFRHHTLHHEARLLSPPPSAHLGKGHQQMGPELSRVTHHSHPRAVSRSISNRKENNTWSVPSAQGVPPNALCQVSPATVTQAGKMPPDSASPGVGTRTRMSPGATRL